VLNSVELRNQTATMDLRVFNVSLV